MVSEKELQDLKNRLEYLVYMTSIYLDKYYGQSIEFEWNLKNGSSKPDNIEFFDDNGNTTRIINFEELPRELQMLGFQICSFSIDFLKTTKGKPVIDSEDLELNTN